MGSADSVGPSWHLHRTIHRKGYRMIQVVHGFQSAKVLALLKQIMRVAVEVNIKLGVRFREGRRKTIRMNSIVQKKGSQTKLC